METRLLTEKPHKSAPKVALKHAYLPAPGGVESNLLVLLHGLGDTHVPFLTLGRTLQAQLPQCAVLSLEAPLQVPMLGGGMWWEHWDELGEGERGGGLSRVQRLTLCAQCWSRMRRTHHKLWQRSARCCRLSWTPPAGRQRRSTCSDSDKARARQPRRR